MPTVLLNTSVKNRRVLRTRRLSTANSLPKDFPSPEENSFDHHASNQGPPETSNWRFSGTVIRLAYQASRRFRRLDCLRYHPQASTGHDCLAMTARRAPLA